MDAGPSSTREPAPDQLVTDSNEPGGDDRSLRSAAALPWCRGRRICCRRRRGTAFRLKQIGVVRLRIDGNRLGAGDGRDRRDDRVLVSGVLMDDGDVAFAAIGDVDQLLRQDPSRARRRACRSAIVATTLPVLASTTTEVLLQPEKMRFVAWS